jgi:hypothetical protein
VVDLASTNCALAPTSDERKDESKKKLTLLDKLVKKSAEKKKNKSNRDKPNREKDFNDLLDDEELSREFQAYLVKIFCVENLFFYRDVNKFLKVL